MPRQQFQPPWEAAYHALSGSWECGHQGCKGEQYIWPVLSCDCHVQRAHHVFFWKRDGQRGAMDTGQPCPSQRKFLELYLSTMP